VIDPHCEPQQRLDPALQVAGVWAEVVAQRAAARIGRQRQHAVRLGRDRQPSSAAFGVRANVLYHVTACCAHGFCSRHVVLRAHRYHVAAVKALAWCPFQPNTLASGGGTADRRIAIWNTVSGVCSLEKDTNSQVLDVSTFAGVHCTTDDLDSVARLSRRTAMRACEC
jgi:hypothetical protein